MHDSLNITSLLLNFILNDSNLFKMCGIFAIFNNNNEIDDTINYKSFFDLLKHRGPNHSTFQTIDNFFQIGFHRLSIMDPSNGNQPFVNDEWVIVCNGEIYNYKKLLEIFKNTNSIIPDLKIFSQSDCEILLYFFQLLSPFVIPGILDAEFVFVAYNKKYNHCYIARDIYGIKPLFIGKHLNKTYFASECKSLSFCEFVVPFLPGHIMFMSPSDYYYGKYTVFPNDHKYLPDKYSTNINFLLDNAVKKRLQTTGTRIGCLLSGGLDSSLVAAIANKYMPNLQLFTIGMDTSSSDVIAAKCTSTFMRAFSRHHIVNFTVEQGFNAIRDVIYHLESYDITTVRASIPQYLLSQYISQHSNVKILLSGEGADELFCGYQYSKYAPNANDLVNDSKRLLSELYLFDNLRTDRTTAAFGLEVRLPFLDKQLVEYVMLLNPSLKSCSDKKMEKLLLRDSFRYSSLLPQKILYRRKEAFSDGVSTKDKKWFELIKEKIEKVVDDEECKDFVSKEAYYYHKIFVELFGESRTNLIPRYWMPKWVETKDPSATVLELYQN